MSRLKRSFWLGCAASLSLAGCVPTEAEIGTAGVGAISAPIAEGLSVREGLSFGRSPEQVALSHLGALSAVDFEGRPFLHLVFSAPDAAIADPLRFDVTSANSEAPFAENPYTTSLVGASTERTRVSRTGSGLELLGQIQATAKTMGGFARLVAASSVQVLLEGADGRFWAPGATESLGEETVAELKRDYAAAYLELHNSGAHEWIAEGWKQVLGTEPLDPTLLTGGHLDLQALAARTDLAKVAELLQSDAPAPLPERDGEVIAQGLVSISNEDCYQNPLNFFRGLCRRQEVGRFSQAGFDTLQAHRADQDESFNVKSCFGGAMQNQVVQGCGPAAFTSLIWREWVNGARYTFIPEASAEERVGQTGRKTYRPDRFDRMVGQELVNKMGTCHVNAESGSMTLPWDLESGGNAWLKTHATPFVFKSSYTLGAANALTVEAKRKILNERVGKEKGAVVAGFAKDALFLKYHYAPVSEYRFKKAYEGGIRPSIDELYVRAFDRSETPDTWYALHDPLSALSGLFWLQPR
jgi:hypothetical protein